MNDAWEQELQSGHRFGFGRNWRAFLDTLDEGRIAIAQDSLTAMLGRPDLSGLRFVDVGCGSGLFSLAARRLGTEVVSLDFDPQSVACANILRNRFHPDDEAWTIHRGSALDARFLATLGDFDIVYSWGVLHHTGAMWQAIDNVLPMVRPGGQLFLSIYNDCDWKSRLWTRIKRLYNAAPAPARLAMVLAWIFWSEAPSAFIRLTRGMNPWPGRYWREHRIHRGMSKWHDYVDWVGGYPFEVAKPHEIFNYVLQRGFTLTRMVTPGPSHFCNEYVFRRVAVGEKDRECAV